MADSDDFLGLGEAKGSREIAIHEARRVFKDEFAQERAFLQASLSKQESLSHAIIFGSVMVSIIFLCGIIWDSRNVIAQSEKTMYYTYQNSIN